jgi:hypothetical protein
MNFSLKLLAVVPALFLLACGGSSGPIETPDAGPLPPTPASPPTRAVAPRMAVRGMRAAPRQMAARRMPDADASSGPDAHRHPARRAGLGAPAAGVGHGGAGRAGNALAVSSWSFTTLRVPNPNPPTLSGTTPTSPGTSRTPSVLGQASAGLRVELFTTADCSGTAVASGTATASGTFSIPVTVAANASPPSEQGATRRVTAPSSTMATPAGGPPTPHEPFATLARPVSRRGARRSSWGPRPVTPMGWGSPSMPTGRSSPPSPTSRPRWETTR